MTIKDEYHIRQDKMNALQNDGAIPYPSTTRKNTTIRSVLDTFDQLAGEEKSIIVAGRLMVTRIHGKMAFADLRDASGEIQIQLTVDHIGETEFQRFVDCIDPADFVEIEGIPFLTKRGQQTIGVRSWKILSKALRPLPEKWHGLKDIETRYRERELDLIANADIRETFRIRSKVIRALRQHLDAEGFEEVETPVLQAIAGGATARPFITHHNALNHDFYLRIAPELFLKRCVVGGYEKVYELGRQFRNEGVDWSHNPEFTSLEFYWAYKDYQALMDFTVEYLQKVIQDVLGTLSVEFDGNTIDFSGAWPRKRFADAIKEKTGIDITALNKEELVSKMKELRIDADYNHADIGKLYDELYKEVVRKDQIQPLFIIDYPIEMEPLAKKCQEDPRFVQRFQLLAGGLELLKAYSELNDPIDQRQRFEAQQALREAGDDEAQYVDEGFLKAMEHGMPPTAGWGMGVDRFVMMLANQPGLKEVILFPTLKPQEESPQDQKESSEETK